MPGPLMLEASGHVTKDKKCGWTRHKLPYRSGVIKLENSCMEDKRSCAHQVQCPIAPFQLPWRPLLGLFVGMQHHMTSSGPMERDLELSEGGTEMPMAESAASFTTVSVEAS